MFRSTHRLAQLSVHLKSRNIIFQPNSRTLATMPHLFEDATPSEVKNGKGLSLVTQSTPNGQKVQIMLEELSDVYKNVEWTTTLMSRSLSLAFKNYSTGTATNLSI